MYAGNSSSLWAGSVGDRLSERANNKKIVNSFCARALPTEPDFPKELITKKLLIASAQGICRRRPSFLAKAGSPKNLGRSALRSFHVLFDHPSSTVSARRHHCSLPFIKLWQWTTTRRVNHLGFRHHFEEA